MVCDSLLVLLSAFAINPVRRVTPVAAFEQWRLSNILFILV
jgi:hypothetical protein